MVEGGTALTQNEPTEAAAKLVFEEARRLLVRQEADLDSFRVRSLGVLSAAGLISGLFAQRVFTGHVHGTRLGFAVAALVSFAVLAACVVRIQVLKKWDFSYKVEDIIKPAREGSTATEIALTLAEKFDADRQANEAQMQPIRYLFTTCLATLGAVLVLWGVAAAT
jgi:hypothetical protein